MTARPSFCARHAAGLFRLSLATLLLELSLTRVLSVTLWYHIGFLVISTALLGFGVSGVMLAIWRSLGSTPHLDRALSLFALGFSIAVVASFWCMQRIPFDPLALATDHRQLLFMPLYLIVVAVPFFFAGGAISLLLTRGGASVNRLYAFDLLGAGLGCALIAWVMPHLCGPAVCSFLRSWGHSRRFSSLACPLGPGPRLRPRRHRSSLRQLSRRPRYTYPRWHVQDRAHQFAHLLCLEHHVSRAGL
jgi:hypothetical protein